MIIFLTFAATYLIAGTMVYYFERQKGNAQMFERQLIAAVRQVAKEKGLEIERPGLKEVAVIITFIKVVIIWPNLFRINW
jgi:hypothetical protein